MKRAILAVATTAAGLVLLLSFKTHGTTPPAMPQAVVSTMKTTTAATAATTTTARTTATPTAAPTTTARTTTAAAGASPKVKTSKTVTGSTVDTQYGPVQVQITVASGKATAVQAVQYPSNDSRSQQINAYAIPVLNQEATAAGSARIDMVSGATYTSDGYLQSLQSALNTAGIA